jgi:hypothetical protein
MMMKALVSGLILILALAQGTYAAYPSANWTYQPSRGVRPTTVVIVNDTQSKLPVDVTFDSTVFAGVTFSAAPSTYADSVTARITDTVGVSGQVSIAGSVPVTGAFYPETQPINGQVEIIGQVSSVISDTLGVKGQVSILNFPASQPVTGAFYQETQPVSGQVTVAGNVNATVSDTIGINGQVGIIGPVSVTGSFYPDTQPVSGQVEIIGNVASTISDTVGVKGQVGIIGSIVIANSITTAKDSAVIGASVQTIDLTDTFEWMEIYADTDCVLAYPGESLNATDGDLLRANERIIRNYETRYLCVLQYAGSTGILRVRGFKR